MGKNQHPKHLLLLILLPAILSLQSALAVDFVFNGFNSSDMLLLYSNATVESRILTLTNSTNFSIGRALYKSKIPAKAPNSSYVYPFSTSFIFSIAPYKNTLPGHGMVFIFTPVAGIKGTSSSQHLGLFNFTNDGIPSNHVFGVEFDVFKNEEFQDINDNHVGIDVNSLKSVEAHEAGYWPENSDFKKLKLNNGENYQVWIDYKDFFINVTMDEMFVGFTSSTGQLVESHKRHRRLAREREDMEDWELEFWPHRITYQEIEAATKSFGEENVIGVGANGKVYKGVLAGGQRLQ
ncbi:Concanavalin A-like lectin protein kinase family protein [Prunus dulcis]|uniref:Concanavalin A-like lectin protein kinase family protein n=1 Tax=Prunus dulcis TaxID=3755 RepID=A0A4Y1RAJ5_PRUDU|nr:Concanavalin A-like lectin protein kinase family protein [Prunus dulcis]